MKIKTKSFLNFILIFTIIYLYSKPRYIWWLPTIPVYDNAEAIETYNYTKKLTRKDYDFFYLTDQSVVNAFLPHVFENKDELHEIEQKVTPIILFFKYLINRPRPKQIEEKINTLKSNTSDTPSLPAGHAFQAYYIAKILSKKYPEKKKLLDKIAHKCDDVRVKAGIHYISDGQFSKKIVSYL